MSPSEEDVREMLTLLDRYRYQAELMSQQLSMLTATEAELGAAWNFIRSYGDVEEGSEVMVPIGGGVMVAAKAGRPNRVLTPVGNDIHVEMDLETAAQNISERRDSVREIMQQVRAGIEQTEASAKALSEQAEAAFQELQDTKAAQGF